MKKLLVLFTLTLLFSSCNEYHKALKKDDVVAKFDVATKMYDVGKYSKAIRLIEQIAPIYKGKPQAEKLFYMYSQSLYKTEQYYLASYQFGSFGSSYPRSEKHEEALFLEAKCLSKLSPKYSLDQTETYKAVDKLQSYIDLFPDSPNYSEANAIAKELREKLELKAFENAKIYNTISDYKASLVTLDNFLIDHPGSKYKEDALFYKFDSSYNLAINSVLDKKEERLNNAKIAYENLMKFKSDSKYKEKADMMLAYIERKLQQFNIN